MGGRGEDGVGEGVGERGEDEKIVIFFLLSEKNTTTINKKLCSNILCLCFKFIKNLYVLICY